MLEKTLRRNAYSYKQFVIAFRKMVNGKCFIISMASQKMPDYATLETAFK